MFSFLGKIKLSGAESFARRQKKIWDEPLRPALWRGVFPPLRPSVQDKEIYETELKKSRPGKILILGATPELRTIAAESGAQKIFVADFSLNMLQGMQRYADTGEWKKEEWLLQNWLGLTVELHSFDVILGDLVVRQIPTSLQGQFFKKIRDYLSPSGVFITRVQYKDTRIPTIPIEVLCGEIFDFYGSLDKGEGFSALRSRLYQRLQVSLFDFVFLNRIRARRDMKFLKKKFNPVADRIFSGQEPFTPFFSQKWWILPRQDLGSIITEKFYVEKERFSEDYLDSLYFPILTLRTKK